MVVSLRLIRLDTFPSAEWDESVYQCIADNWTSTGSVIPKDDIEVMPSFEKGGYWYHPPFYFIALGEWFKLTGSTMLDSARSFAALSNILMLTLLLLFAKELLGSWQKAIVSCLIIATDAWLVISARTAWFENQMMLLGVISLILWHYASKQEVGNAKSFAYLFAGLFAGFALVFKHVGIVFPLALAIHWFFDIKKDWRERIIALYTIFLVVISYLLFGLSTGGMQFYTHTLHQYLRTTSTEVKSGGVNFSIAEALEIVFSSSYIIFIPSIIVLGIAGLTLLKDVVTVIKGKRVSIIACWAIAALLFFGAIRLRNPHYALMYLTPLGFYLGMKIAAQWNKQVWLIAIYVVVSLFTLGYRFTVPDQALNDARAYISQEIPANQVIVTEESVACGVPQDYLSIRLRKNQHQEKLQQYDVHYVALLESRSYSPDIGPEFQVLLDEGNVVANFADYKWNISIIKIK